MPMRVSSSCCDPCVFCVNVVQDIPKSRVYRVSLNGSTFGWAKRVEVKVSCKPTDCTLPRYDS